MKRHLQLLATFVAALVIGLNPLIGPVATAYAINEELAQQDSSAEVADSANNADLASASDSSVSVGSWNESDNLAEEEIDSSVISDGGSDVSADSYQYLYIAYPQLPVGVDQVIAFATPSDSDVIADATLELESTTGHTFFVVASAINANTAAFQFGKDYAECGYDLISIAYHLQGDDTAHNIDLMQCGYAFDIDANAPQTTVLLKATPMHLSTIQTILATRFRLPRLVTRLLPQMGSSRFRFQTPPSTVLM